MPITLRIDKQIHDAHPELTEMQRESLDRQLQENMGALSPQAKALAPEEIIRPNASMNAAFAKFFAGLWNAPMIVAPYIAAGYGDAATALLSLNEQIPAGSDHDRELVDAWRSKQGLTAGSKRKLGRWLRNSRSSSNSKTSIDRCLH